MAWVRTATSLISFGFTIYKFFQFDVARQPLNASPLIGPRGFALLMITIGLVSLALSTVQHRRDMKALRDEFGNVPVLDSRHRRDARGRAGPVGPGRRSLARLMMALNVR